MICDYVKKPPRFPVQLPAEATRILRYWVGNDDGLAGSRVLEILRREIESARALRAG